MLHQLARNTTALKKVPSAIGPCSSRGNHRRSKPRKGTTASLAFFSHTLLLRNARECSQLPRPHESKDNRREGKWWGNPETNNQSMWSWKMRRTYPGYPSSWVAQKGQAAWRPLVPCGMDTEAQYLTVFSEAM